MSRKARITAQAAAVGVVLATGAAGGLLAASLPQPTPQPAATIIAPAPELTNPPLAPAPTRMLGHSWITRSSPYVAHLEVVMTTASLQVWRTELQVSVRAAIDADLLDGCLRGAVARLEAAASRFQPDSELVLLSRRAGTFVPVSDLLLELMRTALAAAEATDGLVHPGLGGVVAAAGYDAWAGEQTSITGDRRIVPWQDIEIDPHGAIRIPRGMVLDLGATAKAWLADTVARDLAFATGADALANMGGDIRCISAGEPWTIWLDPELPGVDLVAVDLRDAGVATSGLARRRWAGGHHIIDPRTAAPAQTPWWSAAVIAADAVGANTAATAAMVLGAEAPGWLTGLGLSARLVTADGVETRIGPWAAAEKAA